MTKLENYRLKFASGWLSWCLLRDLYELLTLKKKWPFLSQCHKTINFVRIKGSWNKIFSHFFPAKRSLKNFFHLELKLNCILSISSVGLVMPSLWGNFADALMCVCVRESKRESKRERERNRKGLWLLCTVIELKCDSRPLVGRDGIFCACYFLIKLLHYILSHSSTVFNVSSLEVMLNWSSVIIFLVFKFRFFVQWQEWTPQCH